MSFFSLKCRRKFITALAVTFLAWCLFAVSCGGGGAGEDGSDMGLPPEPPNPDVEVTEPAKIHPKVGFSAFAIQSASWDCEGFLAGIDRIEEWHMAMLWRTFGTNNSCLDRVLASPKLKSIEIHLINEACHRRSPGTPGACNSHEFLGDISPGDWEWRLKQNDPNLINHFQDYAFQVANYLDEKLRTGAECFISPGLESNLEDGQAISNLIQATRLVFPRCKIVWNPLGLSDRYGADFIEGHSAGGPIPSPCIKNLDGQDIRFNQRPSHTGNFIREDEIFAYFERTRNCEFSLLWTVESNCQPPQGGISINPRDRDCSNKQFIYDLQADYIVEWQNNNKPQ